MHSLVKFCKAFLEEFLRKYKNEFLQKLPEMLKKIPEIFMKEFLGMVVLKKKNLQLTDRGYAGHFSKEIWGIPEKKNVQKFAEGTSTISREVPRETVRCPRETVGGAPERTFV